MEIGFLFLGLLLGVEIGCIIGIVITQKQFKKSVNSKCKKCKYFNECMGFKKWDDNNGNCRFYTESEDSDIEKDLIKQQIEDLDRQVENIEKKVYDNERQK